jgi:hypothetical protein
MPEVVFETLIDNQTPVPPGGRIASHEIDVKGARTVSLSFGIISNDAQVRWGIFFGRTTNNAFAPFQQGTFGANNLVLVNIPVIAPQLIVFINNDGASPTNADGTVYFIRDVT